MTTDNQKEYKSALAVALRFLNHKDRTEHEICERLIKDEYDEKIIAEVISYLKEQGYVNDKRYAEYYYICYKEKRSIRRIKTELTSKGIEESIIDDVETSLDVIADSQREAVERVLKKQLTRRKIKDYATASYEEKCSIKAALYRQGYAIDIIADVLND